VLLIFPLTSIGYLITSQQNSETFVKTINRSFSTPEEENALLTAENADYSKIFNVSRFCEAEYEGTLTNPNFIDSGVIKYYNNTFDTTNERLQSKGFYYSTNSSKMDNVRAVFDNSTNRIGLVNILDSNGITISSLSAYGLYAYNNNSDIQEIDSHIINFDFSNCYMVTTELRYSETYGNLGAFLLHSRQAVVLSADYRILFIGTWASLGQA
jgi:hypothetical protein